MENSSLLFTIIFVNFFIRTRQINYAELVFHCFRRKKLDF